MKADDQSRGMEADDWDVRRIREDFPILGRMVHGNKPLTYLDNAATTQKPVFVARGLCDYYQAANANVRRSLHYLAGEATKRYDDARRKVAAFIGAEDERTVVFTPGTTESVNLVAHGWGRKFIRAGDEILLTEMEHHSNLIPGNCWRRKAGGSSFRSIRPDGTLDGEAFHRMLSPRVKLAAFTHISNVAGHGESRQRMTGAARKGGRARIDRRGAKRAHRPVNVRDLDCDFLAFSGHKMWDRPG
jgi:cysteine desulfurase/selenocysteine lyase